eukprot:scaffold151823_cov23-Tisochrysis_lutea.AAC.3
MGGHEPPLSPLLPCCGGRTTHPPRMPNGLQGANGLANSLTPPRARLIRSSWPGVGSPVLQPLIPPYLTSRQVQRGGSEAHERKQGRGRGEEVARGQMQDCHRRAIA